MSGHEEESTEMPRLVAEETTRLALNAEKDYDLMAHVLLGRVPVQVHIRYDLPLLLEPFHHLLDVPHRGVALLERAGVNTVQVHLRERAAVVAVDHAVRVQHRYDLDGREDIK